MSRISKEQLLFGCILLMVFLLKKEKFKILLMCIMSSNETVA